jgi:hypothetical protein
MREIKLLGDTSTEFLCGSRRFLLVHWLNSDSYYSILLAPIRFFKIAKKDYSLANPRICLLVHRNLLQCC